jgi:hypothetical protein
MRVMFSTSLPTQLKLPMLMPTSQHLLHHLHRDTNLITTITTEVTGAGEIQVQAVTTTMSTKDGRDTSAGPNVSKCNLA